MKKLLSLLILCFYSTTYAVVLKHKVYNSTDLKFSFKKVCELYQMERPVYIFKEKDHKLDCTKKSVSIHKLCSDMKQNDLSYVSSVIDEEKELVTCIYGKSVFISIMCSSRDLYCKKNGCRIIKPVFAHTLEVSMDSFNEEEHTLNCLYHSDDGSIDL